MEQTNWAVNMLSLPFFNYYCLTLKKDQKMQKNV
jgi:hypothetical protein